VKRVCKVCGETEENHHEPEWLEIPDGCVCEWREWDWDRFDALPSPCAEYKSDGYGLCRVCEHQPECHRGAKP
jgi:hypothetical protein